MRNDSRAIAQRRQNRFWTQALVLDLCPDFGIMIVEQNAAGYGPVHHSRWSGKLRFAAAGPEPLRAPHAGTSALCSLYDSGHFARLRLIWC